MVIRVRKSLGRQNNKKKEGEVRPQIIEQRILQVLNGLQGGCYKIDCICQAFPELDNSFLSEQVASVFNELIVSGKIKLSRIRLNHGRAIVYFAVRSQKTKVTK